MKSIELVGIMKTASSVMPLEGDNKFLVKYGNHKQVVIVVEQAAQPAAEAVDPECRHVWLHNIEKGWKVCDKCGERRR
jgi:hypothetical protein